MEPQRKDDRALRAYLRTIRRRKGVVLLAVLLVPATALLVSASQKPEYEASASVVLKQGPISGAIAGSQSQLNSTPSDREIETQAQLAHTPAIAKRVLAAVPVKDKSVDDLLSRATVTPNPNADILEFSVREPDPGVAQRLANEYARQYTLYRQRFDKAPLGQAVDDVRRQLGQLGASVSVNLRGSLGQQIGRVLTQQALPVASASVVNPALSATKTGPHLARVAVAALLLGALFGVGLAFLWETLDTRLRSADEISEGLDLPLLARVPSNGKRFGPDSVPVMMSDSQSPEAESFRSLRASFEFVNLEPGARSVLVTSAHPGEGKSSVAANLAIALSRAGRRVTLVDLDLRRPSLARQFRLSGGAGLTDVAVGSSKLEDALTTIGPKGSTLRVLTSGPTPPDAGEFCTTVALESILDDVRRTSDLVLVDCPPLLNLGDAIALSNKVDAILLVTRSGFLRRPALAELRRALFTCPAEKLGFVLTEASRDDWLANGGLS